MRVFLCNKYYMPSPKINYIKPVMIHVNKGNTVKKNLPNQNANKPVQPNRVSVEERRIRLERIRNYQLADAQRKMENMQNRHNANRPNANQPKEPLKKDEVVSAGKIIKFGSIEPIWKDQDVYIVGGGPSLTGFDFNRLVGKNVIAVNKAYTQVIMPYVLYWTDSRFYNWYKSEIDYLKCTKITTSLSIKDISPDVIILKNKGSKEMDINAAAHEICAGNNSGYGAIHLAIKMGAKRIYLLGYDLQPAEKKTHWHSGYPSNTTHKDSVYKSMLDYFTKNAHIINAAAEVYNVNNKSAITCFKFCSLDDALG